MFRRELWRWNSNSILVSFVLFMLNSFFLSLIWGFIYELGHTLYTLWTFETRMHGAKQGNDPCMLDILSHRKWFLLQKRCKNWRPPLPRTAFFATFCWSYRILVSIHSVIITFVLTKTTAFTLPFRYSEHAWVVYCVKEFFTSFELGVII